MSSVLEKAKRIVVKVGSSLVTNEGRGLDHDALTRWAGQIAEMRRMGREVVLVSSGAIAAGLPHWQSLDESLATSARFKASGGKLVSVSFDSTLTHRFGETIVMFSHYTVVTEGGGERHTQKGRATEVFVRSNGRWVHTSWHLDEEPS